MILANVGRASKEGARILCCLLVSLSCAFGGCAPHFEIDAGREFVELANDRYDYRATTPDGLVIALREFPNNQERGDLAFWHRAIENRLRLDEGYALLETRKIETKEGLVGTQMRFGLDREEQAHLYWVTVFVTYRGTLTGKKSRVFVLEAGGKEELVKDHQAQIQKTIVEFTAR